MRWLLTVVVVLMLATPAAAVPDVPMPIINQDGTVTYQLVPLGQLDAYIVDTYGVAVGTVRLPTNGPAGGSAYPAESHAPGLYGLPSSAMPIMPEVPGYPNYWK